MPFCLHYNIISNTFLIINLLNQQVSVPHPLGYRIGYSPPSVFHKIHKSYAEREH